MDKFYTDLVNKIDERKNAIEKEKQNKGLIDFNDFFISEFVLPLNSLENVENVQNKFKITIPNELIDIIKNFNGTYFKKNICFIQKFGETDVKCLLSYNEFDDEGIYDVIDYFIKKFDGMIIPFASDSGSGYYCWSNEGVKYYVQEFDKLYFVAPSINEFLVNLK